MTSLPRWHSNPLRIQQPLPYSQVQPDGVSYGSASDSRWHECDHGKAFRTNWMNEAVYLIASFMLLRNPVSWQWNHARHHTDTLIVGRDPETAVKRPPQITKLALHFVGIPDVVHRLLVQ